ncbi:MAG: Glucosamine-6-phosphate deaminase 1 [candidate division TA06 bacterium ADurb.Bin417]|uniref:Glucosamine-6-phosphate deaminase n=1 Tax=candidate division TA06 bacterium ADurb.Bin417 TaxID=1852828 RepID=A0A1V5MIH3_UNCT6|nr:MAG: Glucosamine-6-phosphate deaminase 1 [candidate division TA06 bacterium ADurb.Bin417]
MRIVIVRDYEELSREAARKVKTRLAARPDLKLGLCAGSTPEGLYKELVRLHRDEGLSFKRVQTFNLVEYLGMGPGDPNSLGFFISENLLRHLDIPETNRHVLDGRAENPEKHCRWYEDLIIKAGGIDLQLLGIGRVGHIGFNEPGSSLASRTRIKKLDEQTIQDNSRFFPPGRTAPERGITLGVGTILESEEILLLASSANKAEIVSKAIEGPVTNQVTASILQLHPKVTVILDEAAASCLERKEYYKYAEEQRRRKGE